ncbi:hypothetical protein J6590_059209 [Homalodisca vitripennis]|nr:hypothetical protein J6590_059209 [Homalodisca vitripennis]
MDNSKVTDPRPNDVARCHGDDATSTCDVSLDFANRNYNINSFPVVIAPHKR